MQIAVFGCCATPAVAHHLPELHPAADNRHHLSAPVFDAAHDVRAELAGNGAGHDLSSFGRLQDIT
jgi:hypothetical protein